MGFVLGLLCVAGRVEYFRNTPLGCNTRLIESGAWRRILASTTKHCDAAGLEDTRDLPSRVSPDTREAIYCNPAWEACTAQPPEPAPSVPLPTQD